MSAKVDSSLSSMAKASRYGMMEPSTMATGRMEWPRGKVYSIMQTAMSIQESFITIEQTDSVLTYMRMVRDMKDTGGMICSTGMVRKN